MAGILLVSFLLLILYVLLLLYYRFSWSQIPDFVPDSQVLSTQVTVIVPARNEEHSLPGLLMALSEQSYPSTLFTVLVIDDHSTDNTASIIASFGGNIQLVSLKDHVEPGFMNSFKKKAIETGIQLSEGTLIITTDADCIMGENWLRTIVSFYEKYTPAFIAAPVSINCSNRFIEIFQALDFMTLQGITGASVHKNIHSMCNGANLAYERSAFNDVEGFMNIDSIASGDDMLLMHKIYQRYPERVKFIKSPDAIVNTTPVRSVKEFLNQRIRWASKADKYDDKRIFFVLLLVYIINVLLLALPVIALFDNPIFSFLEFKVSLVGAWLVLLVLKTFAELLFLFPVSRFFGKQRLLLLFPVMQPFHIVYTVIAGWLGKFGSYNWKERQVK